MAGIKETKPVAKIRGSHAQNSISFADLEHRLGPRAAGELFERVDKAQREGSVIHGRNVRDARSSFGRIQQEGNVQVVVARSGGKRSRPPSVSDGLVIIRIDDLEAVVKAAQRPFDWASAFAPRNDLPAATSVPELNQGSRGRRALQF